MTEKKIIAKFLKQSWQKTTATELVSHQQIALCALQIVPKTGVAFR